MKPYDIEEDPMNILQNPTRDRAHAILRGLISGDIDYAEPLARYLLNGGDIHWKNASRAVDRLDPEREEFEDCRELISAIRCALANGDTSGLEYFYS